MNIQEWDKEQKQLVILGIMTVVVIIALGNQLVLGPAKIKAAQAETLIQEKGREKETGERLLRRDPTVRREMREDFSWIRAEREAGKIPRASNKLFWAQRRLYDIGDSLSLKFDVLDYTSSTPRYITPGGTARDYAAELEKLPFWIPFSVEIRARLSFQDLNRLLAELEAQEPYATVALLRITPGLSDPTRHNVQVVVEWPVPREEAEWNQLEGRMEESS